MPLVIENRAEAKEVIWNFFTNWLSVLKKDPDKAFGLLDKAIFDSYGEKLKNISGKDFVELLQNFSGDPDEKYTLDDINLDSNFLKPYFEASQVIEWERDKRLFITVLYFPLKTPPNVELTLFSIFALNFYFDSRSSLECVYNCELVIDDSFLVVPGPVDEYIY